MAVWGVSFIKKFLTIALPTLLAPDNLPLASELIRSRFLIVTTKPDINAIRQSSIFESLSKILPVSFVDFEPDKDRHLSLSKAHSIAIDSAIKNKEIAVFLAPDCIIANGGLYNVMQVMKGGKRAVMTTGLRVIEESFEPILETLPRDEKGILSIESRLITRLVMENLHPEIKRYIWGSQEFTKYPHLCLWKSPHDDGFLIRAFHLHPLIVDLGVVTIDSKEQALNALSSSTVDGNFIGYLIGNLDDIYIVDDSDFFSIYSLTPRADREDSVQYGYSDIKSLRLMAYSNTVNSLHRYFFTKAIRVHVKEIDHQWKELEEETGILANQILNCELQDFVDRWSIIEYQFTGRELLRITISRAIQRLGRILRGQFV
ncbi:MAG: hypothetical protein SAJ11_22430 [Jaaginema sp. PMC 1078.18]|nr:hypothetical protein [Jaaginema sp. PMC 1078.18]